MSVTSRAAVFSASAPLKLPSQLLLHYVANLQQRPTPNLRIQGTVPRQRGPRRSPCRPLRPAPRSARDRRDNASLLQPARRLPLAALPVAQRQGAHRPDQGPRVHALLHQGRLEVHRHLDAHHLCALPPRRRGRGPAHPPLEEVVPDLHVGGAARLPRHRGARGASGGQRCWAHAGRRVPRWLLRDEYLDTMHLGVYQRLDPNHLVIFDPRRALMGACRGGPTWPCAATVLDDKRHIHTMHVLTLRTGASRRCQRWPNKTAKALLDTSGPEIAGEEDPVEAKIGSKYERKPNRSEASAAGGMYIDEALMQHSWRGCSIDAEQ